MEVVRVRAEAMQKASEEINSGMMTTFLSMNSKLKTAMVAAQEYCKQRCDIHDPVCKVANFLYPECKVIAGNTEVGLHHICINGKSLFEILYSTVIIFNTLRKLCTVLWVLVKCR